MEIEIFLTYFEMYTNMKHKNYIRTFIYLFLNILNMRRLYYYVIMNMMNMLSRSLHDYCK